MTSTYIRARIISLQEKKAHNVKIGCLLVANRLQREIDRLEKELQEIEEEVGT